jgi:hypothetical protein
MLDFLQRHVKNNKVCFDPQPIVKVVVPKFFQSTQKASRCFIKNGFCCEDGQRRARVVAVNNSSLLYYCHVSKCENLLVKSYLKK